MPFTVRLTRKLHQLLGEEAAGDLVNWTQEVDAQRAELRESNELNFTRFARLREHKEHFDARMAEPREEMRVAFADMRRDMAVLEARLEWRFSDLIKWSFVFWVGAVAAIAMLAGVMR